MGFLRHYASQDLDDFHWRDFWNEIAIHYNLESITNVVKKIVISLLTLVLFSSDCKV